MSFYKTLTVGELRECLEMFPDDAPVEAYEGEAVGIRIDSPSPSATYKDTLGFICTHYREGEMVTDYRKENAL